MHTIGIVDVTTVGSTICQRRLIELAGINGEHPPFVVHSLPFSQYKTAVINQDWSLMAALIKESVAILDRCEVDFIIIPSNTPHYAYTEYSQYTQTPIINLIDLTAEACQEQGMQHVAVLGTMATMTGDLYQAAFESRGLTIVRPENNIAQAIHNFILDEIVPDCIQAITRTQILESLKRMNCDGFVLGCTELPEVYSTDDLIKPAIDTTRLLAEKAYYLALNYEDEDTKRFFRSI